MNEIKQPEMMQDLAEERWSIRAAEGHVHEAVPPCWCSWYYRTDCHMCPLAIAMGFVHCDDFEPYDRWARDPSPENARVLYDLLVQHRHQIITTAYEILDERRKK